MHPLMTLWITLLLLQNQLVPACTLKMFPWPCLLMKYTFACKKCCLFSTMCAEMSEYLTTDWNVARFQQIISKLKLETPDQDIILTTREVLTSASK